MSPSTENDLRDELRLRGRSRCAQNTNYKAWALDIRLPSSALHMRVGALNEVARPWLARHHADEAEASTYRGDRLLSHSHQVGQHAEGEDRVLAADRAISIHHAWLPRARRHVAC